MKSYQVIRALSKQQNSKKMYVVGRRGYFWKTGLFESQKRDKFIPNF